MVKRRGHGEGSIFQRKDGRWTGEVQFGWNNGRPYRKAVYGSTKKSVQTRLRRVIRDHDLGLGPADDRTTVGSFLGQWLEDVVRPSLRAEGFRSYEHIVRVHLVPKLGKHRLSKLTPLIVQRFLNAQEASGLSGNTVRNHRAVLRRALNQAIKWGLVQQNVASLADPPRVERKEVRPLDRAESLRFIQAIRGHRLEALYFTTLYEGWRLGEALGLTWPDIDFDRRTMQIRRTMQRNSAAGSYYFDEPKTYSSRRVLTMSQEIYDQLRTHRTRQYEERLIAGSKWQGEDWDLVFAAKLGGPQSASVVWHQLQEVLRSAGLRRQRFHDLRHGTASLMLQAGVPMRVVMEQLGHSEMGITATLYSHVAPELQREAVERVGKLLSPAQNRAGA